MNDRGTPGGTQKTRVAPDDVECIKDSTVSFCPDVGRILPERSGSPVQFESSDWQNIGVLTLTGPYLPPTVAQRDRTQPNRCGRVHPASSPRNRRAPDRTEHKATPHREGEGRQRGLSPPEPTVPRRFGAHGAAPRCRKYEPAKQALLTARRPTAGTRAGVPPVVAHMWAVAARTDRATPEPLTAIRRPRKETS